MSIILIIGTALFGCIVGSFLNVVVLRYQTGRGIGGRSSCGSCNRVLRWFELVPVLSFLVQRARCRRCKSKLSWQYPLVEAATGLVTAALVVAHGFTVVTVIYMLAAWLLIAITVYDMRHFIIPDAWTAAIAVIGIGGQIVGVLPLVPAATSWLDVAAGALFALPFLILWRLSRGRLMGLGDPKLMVALGLLLGFSAGLSALTLAFWVGAVVSVLLMLISQLRSAKQVVTLQTAVPFGPFLALGALVQMVVPVPILTLFF